MTRVLYLVADGPCSHCYGTDHLLTGFFNVLGHENVFDYPEKDCVHLASIEDRDSCQIDSDSTHARKNHRFEDVYQTCDLVVLTAPDPRLYDLCRVIPQSIPIVGVDFSDTLGDFRQPYERVAARPLAAYFKRELPLGESFAVPFPLSYPASRVPEPMPEKANRVFYWATSHGGGGPGKPRLQIVWDLTTMHQKETWQLAYDVSGSSRTASNWLDIHMTPGQAKGTRPSPELYHERMAESLIGIHWNGARCWDGNRFHENFAYGLCQVAERPRIQMLNMPEDGAHCFYVDKPEEVAPLVKELLEDEEYTRQVAAAGHAHWRAHHSSERRAEAILQMVGKLGA